MKRWFTAPRQQGKSLALKMYEQGRGGVMTIDIRSADLASLVEMALEGTSASSIDRNLVLMAADLTGSFFTLTGRILPGWRLRSVVEYGDEWGATLLHHSIPAQFETAKTPGMAILRVICQAKAVERFHRDKGNLDENGQ